MSHTRTLRLLMSVCALAMNVSSLRAQAQNISPVIGSCTINTAKGVPQAETSPAPETRAGIKLTVTGGDGKPLQRKRFYLLEKDIGQVVDVSWNDAPRRDNFLNGASRELREWLKRHDCDTLYCPEYEAEYETAVQTVPEFKRAYDEGLRRYKNPELALRWMTVNFPLKNIRTEFYERKKAWLDRAARQGGKVLSVMTDEKGVAYFTGVELRTYYISNLIPLEEGNVLWNCKVTVPPPLPRQLYSVSVEFAYPILTAPTTGK